MGHLRLKNKDKYWLQMKKKNVPVTFSLKEPLLWSTFVQNNGMQILTPNEKKNVPVTLILLSFR